MDIFRALATNFLSSMQSKIEEFRKSASTLEKECDKGKCSMFPYDIIDNVLYVELKKSISEAKGACSRTVKTSKNLEKKTKKGIEKLKNI